MTLPASGSLSMSQIHAEFGYGQKLSDYVGKKWYKADGTEGTFSNPVAISNFYGTSKTRLLHKLSYTVTANDPRTFSITTGSTSTRADLRNVLKDVGWDAITKFELTLTVNASKRISSIDQYGVFPSGSVVKLVIGSGGGVYGKGGWGGLAHNMVGAQEGRAGSDAILLRAGTSGVAWQITNNGTIAGGGGGGGGAGGYPSADTGAGGGGGAGYPGGTGAATGGSDGTLTTGGSGATTGSNKGGKGGNLGAAGAAATGDRAKSGGPGGYALRGGSGMVTWIKTGTRIGTVA